MTRPATRFVLDASFALAWCFHDEGTERTRGALDDLGEGTALVPDVLWQLEVWNALLGATRRGRLSAQGARESRAILAELAIRPATPPLTAVFELARAHGLSSYDGAYLALALQQGLPLASLDRELNAAAERVGVRLYGAE